MGHREFLLLARTKPVIWQKTVLSESWIVSHTDAIVIAESRKFFNQLKHCFACARHEM